ncbi:TetR/AcrR family transcriptional regulator [Cellulomonas sp. URHD0024]|uniref:TetR/AcrR family transcriptional regulator n=1 Tax=Cellulomonas sp. URHD0024 TaxID=1302620 RepID=UPI0003F8D45C|nr:TetR/AcrR family transcriptional regulator [Cellulomonas sp. URHD0024]
MEIVAPPAKVRAAPLPPDERRAAILTAVRPVLLERGAAVTTRELAEAAGVAEGTLFRVFTDKRTLVYEAVMAAVDPAAGVPEINAVDMSLPLRERLVVLTQLGFARAEAGMRWMQLLHEVSREEPASGDRHAEMRAWARRTEPGNDAVREAVLAVLAPDADALRLPVEDVEELFLTVILGTTMRAVDQRRRGMTPAAPDPERLVDLLLHGVLRNPQSPERSA